MHDASGFGLGEDALPFVHSSAPDDAALASAAAAANLLSGACVLTLAALHARRAFECKDAAHLAASHAVWDWMCASDPFASYSFLPLHMLAAVVSCAWLFFALRGGALRALGNHYASSATPLMLEVFLACYAACWFAPANPFAATDDCFDSDPTCSQWAASGECEKNKDFMLKTCRLACKACVASARTGWAAMGPRAVTKGAGMLLLAIATCRLMLSSLSESTQHRVLAAFRLLLRPLSMLAACIMRTPFAPLVRFVARLIRLAFGSVLSLLRLVATLCTTCANMCRRNLIVALGGRYELEKAFTD